MDYTFLFFVAIASVLGYITGRTNRKMPAKLIVLEHFVGYVESIEGRNAKVVLKNTRGILYSEYDRFDLAEYNIGENDFFNCTLVLNSKGNEEIKIKRRQDKQFMPRPTELKLYSGASK